MPFQAFLPSASPLARSLPARAKAEVGLRSHRGRHGRCWPPATAAATEAAGGQSRRRSVHRPFVRRRSQRCEQLRLDHGPGHVQRLVEVHLEGNGPAAHQRHAHILPVLFTGIVHDRPPLQHRLAVLLRGQHQPVARLPDGVLDDVAHADLALAFAVEAQGNRLLLRVVREGQRLQGPAELTLQDGIEEANPLHIGQLDTAHPFSAPHVQHLDLDDAVLADLLLLLLDADDAARDVTWLGRIALRQGDFHLFPARLAEDGPEARVAGQVDGERLQRLLDGGLAVVGDGGNDAAVHVLEHHALEQVVHVLHREREIDPGVPLDGPFALEVADAAAVQDGLGDGQLRPGRLRGRSGAGSPAGDGDGFRATNAPTARTSARGTNKSVRRMTGLSREVMHCRPVPRQIRKPGYHTDGPAGATVCNGEKSKESPLAPRSKTARTARPGVGG